MPKNHDKSTQPSFPCPKCGDKNGRSMYRCTKCNMLYCGKCCLGGSTNRCPWCQEYN